MRGEMLKERWEKVLKKLSDLFSSGEDIDIEGVIYLIGLQEVGILDKKLKKDQKIDIMHVAICTLLEPYGYYRFEHYDSQGWPHFKLLESLPSLKAGEQAIFMKEAIVNYFSKKEFID